MTPHSFHFLGPRGRRGDLAGLGAQLRSVSLAGALVAVLVGCSGELPDDGRVPAARQTAEGADGGAPTPRAGEAGSGGGDSAPDAGNAGASQPSVLPEVGGDSATDETPGAVDDEPTATAELAVPGQTRIPRLTHLQYDNTVSDLLYLELQPSQEFTPDPVFGGYDNNQNQLRVADRLGRDYRRAAEELAERAVNDEAAFGRLLICPPEEAGCDEAFIEELGLRAYRRPLSPQESARFVDLFEQGEELVGSGDAFRDGARLVIEAMLQSPNFLYRVELSGAEGDTAVELAPSELAQRLSYLLWNTMPDAALRQAVAEGELTSADDVTSVVESLLGSERAHAPVLDFHSQWLRLDKFADLQRDEGLFPAFSSTLPLQEETLRFVEYVGFEQEQGYRTLLTAPFTFADRDLARLYGLEGDFDDTLRRVDLDPRVRGGLLTQIGFLAAHAHATETSPILRGVFINRTILCNEIPDPPSNLNTSETAVDNPRTTREAVEQQTAGSACSNCHNLINPPGFAFEHFDAVGQLRETDRGNPVNTGGEFTIDGQVVRFDSATELLAAIGDSSQGRACFARNLLRYAYGRAENAADEALIENLAGRMSSDDFGVKRALAELALDPAFLTRAPNED